MAVDFVEDPITHIVSITIGITGGIVVMSDQRVGGIHGGNRWRGAPTATGQKWQQIGDEYEGRFFCQSYALVKANPADPGKPTFLIGGGFETPDTWPEIETYGEIHYSNDGENWSVVHREPAWRGGGGMVGLVWHEANRRFYALHQGLNVLSFDGGAGPANGFQIFSSFDGVHWNQIQSFVADEPSDYDATRDAASAAFRVYCIKPANKGQIPDGFQAYDPNTDIFMKPEDLIGWNLGPNFGDNAFDGGIVIEKNGHAIPGGAGLPPGIFAVSFANGVWNALTVSPISPGPRRVYVSADNGASWKEVFSTTGGFMAGMSSGSARGEQ